MTKDWRPGEQHPFMSSDAWGIVVVVGFFALIIALSYFE